MEKKPILGLGIESSCDETSAAIVADGYRIESLSIHSQIAIHAPYSGVVPELASRNHLANINKIIDQALDQANVSWDMLDYISVTNRPGLIGSLIVGLQTAKTISLATGKDLVGINHLAGHIHAPFLQYQNWKGPAFPSKPVLCLLISGGHTSIIIYESPEKIYSLGATRDDACGESFDKVAKLMNLGYPGGPIIEDMARNSTFNSGRSLKQIPIPPILKDSARDDLSFSFSGIKTSVYYLLESLKKKNGVLKQFSNEDIAFALQYRVTELLERNTIRLLEKFKSQIRDQSFSDYFVLSGGVAANNYIRQRIEKTVQEFGLKLAVPLPILCTDNAAMVAAAGYFQWKAGKRDNFSLEASSKPALLEYGK